MGVGSLCKKLCPTLISSLTSVDSKSSECDCNCECLIDNVNRSISQSSGITQITDNHPSAKINFNEFEPLALLGRGTFGKVILVRRKKDNKLYAIKVLKKSKIKYQNQIDHTKTERKILERINHPFIAHLSFAFQDPKKLYFVTEYMAGGELFYHLRKSRIFDENRAKFYICELILAIEGLHKMNCIYRDLKPENILLDKEGHVKLTDFGLSKIIKAKDFGENNIAFTICGTPDYLAPEILEGRGYNKDVDWWSLGALYYEMIAGDAPFRTEKGENKLSLDKFKKPIIFKTNLFSPELKDLISRLLSINVENRIGYKKGAEEIKNHPVFKGVNWEDYFNKKIKPPFVPNIASEVDLGNFDKVFTEENPMRTTPPDRKMLQLERQLQYKYEDFTYDNDNILKKNFSGKIEKY